MRLAAALCFVAAAGCEQGSAPPQAKSAELAGSTVARVGQQDIDAGTVERIAAAQGLAPKSALANAVTDALFAAEARERIPEASSATIARAAAARALLEDMAHHAGAAGPPSDAEVAKISSERWVDLDRPEAVRVSHAVVMRPKSGDLARARALAELIRGRAAGITLASSFIMAAKHVPQPETDPLTVRAESLPYVTADGRTFSGEGPYAAAGQFDQIFARAANALKKPGDLSPVVETSFGFHVIYLEARLPERRVPLEDRRRALFAEVLSRRAASEKAELVARLGKAAPLEVARDADELTAQLVR